MRRAVSKADTLIIEVRIPVPTMSRKDSWVHGPISGNRRPRGSLDAVKPDVEAFYNG